MYKIKERNIIASVIFCFITCGIYQLYWFVCLTDETNEVAGEGNGTSGVMALVLTIVTCGIYGFYWAYRCGEKIDRAKQNRGEYSSNGGVLYLILYLLGGLLALVLIQYELNKLARPSW